MRTARTTNQHSRQPPLERPTAPPEIAMKLKLGSSPACGGCVSCTSPNALASTCGRACLPMTTKRSKFLLSTPEKMLMLWRTATSGFGWRF
eukprot:65214-Pelagomonas_calceolata.AAC.1